MTDPAIRTVSAPEDLATVHRDLLAPNFPADELDSLAGFAAAVASGRRTVLVIEATGGCRGAAVTDRVSPRSSLLSWLAVDDSCRGQGVGALLLQAALASCWTPGVELVVGEIELPGSEPTTVRHGDPVARARFYAKNGARALSVRHWQPPVDNGEFVELLLIAFPEPSGSLEVSSDVVAEFQRAYLAGYENTSVFADALATAEDGVTLHDLTPLYGG